MFLTYVVTITVSHAQKTQADAANYAGSNGDFRFATSVQEIEEYPF